ncbi:hypothetical protein FVER14953_20168 [Fusarium verticillioides]|nr:hypothetical protein FVER14953_20168 [Fusarium verticillioides]
MGSFTFKWEHPADEVYVTGTFDNWTKSVQLEKEGNVFSKTVDLKEPEGKIYYKVRQRQRASTRNPQQHLPFSMFNLHLAMVWYNTNSALFASI